MTVIEFNYKLSTLENKLTTFALKLTRDTHKAQDLIQDTMIKALIHKDQFEDNSNLKAWIYTIMKNTFINDYRRGSRQKTTFDNTANLYFLSSTTESKNDDIESAYAANDIQKEIDRLKDELRIPFTMHVEGYKYQEIADELHLNLGTVKSRIFLARKTLMDALEK